MREDKKHMAQSDPGVSRIEVSGLFGRYDYDLKAPEASDPELERVLILYGGNGSGKTTILGMLYDILSKAPNAGHRTALGNIPFREFRVTFRDGRQVAAGRGFNGHEDLTGPYLLSVSDPSGLEESVLWTPAKPRTAAQEYQLLSRNVILDETGEILSVESPHVELSNSQAEEKKKKQVLAHLTSVVPEAVYFLQDDRSLRSDRFPDPDRRRERLVVSSWESEETQEDSRTVALKKSLDRAHQWISQRVLGASNVGGSQTNQIYVDVARRIATPTEADDPASNKSPAQVRENLLSLGRRNEGFAKLGLVPPAPAAELVDALGKVSGERETAMLSVLVPFADALSARLDALEEIRSSLSTYLDQTSDFLMAKRVTFSLSEGLRTTTDSGEPLDPNNLSSGEKHLLLLLTNTLYTRDDPALYLIDEPELSLNMKWQRRLVDSLIVCTKGSETSFVMASHSFELMAAARERVVTLTQL
jgi:energy-coupling factor transporter ATP-binding protein EcfA2